MAKLVLMRAGKHFRYAVCKRDLGLKRMTG